MAFLISKEGIESEYIKKIKELSGEDINACYHCGKCSAGCPSVDSMDRLPNQIIRAIQIGDIETLKTSNTPWICASCNMCFIRCPRGIDLCAIMEGVRQMILRENEDYIDIKKYSDRLADLPPIAVVSAQRKLSS
ncbi:4Fe-4S dicluster domain-containing protein [candidate division WOR-3 bacterium]|nr:4Fe-4S dicluster domain-containing protein [candidate division WOR-3 bacterium]MCK4527297.1 4Fe-4S dicluster domain-containing protein [candidate division WOR-3 bacterium]